MTPPTAKVDGLDRAGGGGSELLLSDELEAEDRAVERRVWIGRRPPARLARWTRMATTPAGGAARSGLAAVTLNCPTLHLLQIFCAMTAYWW